MEVKIIFLLNCHFVWSILKHMAGIKVTFITHQIAGTNRGVESPNIGSLASIAKTKSMNTRLLALVTRGVSLAIELSTLVTRAVTSTT